MDGRNFAFFVGAGIFLFFVKFSAFRHKNVAAAIGKYQDRIQIPFVRRPPHLDCWGSMNFFNELRLFLVVWPGSVAHYLLKCALTILSLAMGPDVAIAFATYLKTDECGLTLNQMAPSSHSEDSRPDFR